LPVYYLIRHGETEWNKGNIWQGQEDVPLSGRGREQAERLRRRFSGVAVDSVYASPLARAWETASIAFPGRAIHPLPALMERHMGLLQGKTHAEARRIWAWVAEWDRDGRTAAPPQGEDWDSFQRRVLGALPALQGERVAVVAHGGSLRCLLEHLLGVEGPRPGRIRLDNASVSIVERREETWHVHVVNSTLHLL
jgi:broad specificity phosphatase PhoE